MLDLSNPLVIDIVSCCGIRYHWGKGSPSTAFPAPSYDCSGFVQGCLVRLKLLKASEPDRNAFNLAMVSDPVDVAKLGTLAFYGSKGKISHVMLCLNDNLVIGASGGGSKTKGDDPNAIVQVRPLRYRSDLICLGEIKAEHRP